MVFGKRMLAIFDLLSFDRTLNLNHGAPTYITFKFSFGLCCVSAILFLQFPPQSTTLLRIRPLRYIGVWGEKKRLGLGDFEHVVDQWRQKRNELKLSCGVQRIFFKR